MPWVQIAVAVKNKNVGSSFKQLHRFQYKRQFSERKETRHIRNFYLSAVMLLFNDFMRIRINNNNTADRIFIVALISICKVNACDELHAVHIEFVNRFYSVTQFILLSQEFFLHFINITHLFNPFLHSDRP